MVVYESLSMDCEKLAWASTHNDECVESVDDDDEEQLEVDCCCATCCEELGGRSLFENCERGFL